MDVGPPELVAGAILVSLTAYVLLGGADFGGGVWDLLASGPRKARQRALIAEAIGPIWEANHVWLIIVVVLLFTCFPSVFARLAIMLHIPLSLMLIGIVLRGSAFSFRSHYGPGHGEEAGSADRASAHWGRVFASASVITPLLLGICVGAIAAGTLRPPGASGFRDFVATFVAPWLTPFGLSVGVLTLVLFAFLAAVYLTLEARDPALREDFRRRALITAGLAFVAAFGALGLALAGVPRMARALTGGPRALALHAATGAAALTAIAALWWRRFRLARLAAAAQVALILWGWALAQYPYLVPPDLTIRGAAAPRITLVLVLWALVAGGLVLFPSLVYLLRVFKREHAGR
ncbi:MAG TPA: cytochrome d ubiquinol oxidase subunit II [Methylomirabilota bacterium]|nr:cytochrome d ubiquinol oxidase subunit II [Methylomirabilota bacterium]